MRYSIVRSVIFGFLEEIVKNYVLFRRCHYPTLPARFWQKKIPDHLEDDPGIRRHNCRLPNAGAMRAGRR